jgi:hypothetical protein
MQHLLHHGFLLLLLLGHGATLLSQRPRQTG